jgi:BlaI family penicillinase repressor
MSGSSTIRPEPGAEFLRGGIACLLVAIGLLGVKSLVRKSEPNVVKRGTQSDPGQLVATERTIDLFNHGTIRGGSDPSPLDAVSLPSTLVAEELENGMEFTLAVCPRGIHWHLSVICDELPWNCLDSPHTRIVETPIHIGESRVSVPKLSKLEFQIMEALWAQGAASIREIQEAFPAKGRPAYTTVQTTIYRMEGKGAVHRLKRISNCDIFAASVSREYAQRRLIDDLLDVIGESSRPIMSHLIDTGRLSLEDIKEAEKALQTPLKKKERRP